MIDGDWGPAVVAHAAQDAAGSLKVLVVQKSLAAVAAVDVRVCVANFAAAAAEARWEPLTAPAPAGAGAKTGISFGGVTFDGSTDGLPRGVAKPQPVPRQSVGGKACYDLVVPPLSAGLLTL